MALQVDEAREAVVLLDQVTENACNDHAVLSTCGELLLGVFHTEHSNASVLQFDKSKSVKSLLVSVLEKS